MVKKDVVRSKPAISYQITIEYSFYVYQKEFIALFTPNIRVKNQMDSKY